MGENQQQTEGVIVNREGLEDLNDYSAQEIRELFTTNDLVQEGDTITPDDYEAIKRRAKILLGGQDPLSAVAAVLTAGVERLNLMERIGMETLKQMSVEPLRAVFYAETKIMFTNEEINLFKESELPLDEWLQKRSVIRNSLQ